MEALISAQARDPIGRAFNESRAKIGELAANARGAKLSEAERGHIRQAAEEFEAVFLSQMLTPMFESLETDGLFGGGSGERMYRSLMVEEYGKALSRSGGVGIADAVARQIIASQEVPS